MVQKICFAISIVALLHFTTTALGQSMVDNGGFEEGSQKSSATVLSEALGWVNPSEPSVYELRYAHADWLLNSEEEKRRYLAGDLNPKGKAMLGLLVYNKKYDNFREYVTTKLNAPMLAGERYRISFLLGAGTNGEYCGMLASGFGAYLSTKPPSQTGAKRIAVQPQWQMEVLPNRYGWQLVSFELGATENYQYLTLGSFMADADLAISVINEEAFPCSYLLVDEVKVEYLPKPPTVVKQVSLLRKDTVSYQLEALQQQAGVLFDGRAFNIQQSVVVSKVALELTVWDDREADDDIISLNLNGEWILREHKVSKKKLKIDLSLKPDQENYLVLFAHNMGEIPPNTTAISFEDSGKQKRLYLKSDLQTCGTLRLVYKP